MNERSRLLDEIAKRARIAPADVPVDAHLVVEVGLSSVDLLNVLAFVESTCGVRFPDTALASLTTVTRIEEAVRAARERKSA